MDVKEIGLEGVGWIDRFIWDKWWALMNKKLNFRNP
jgi:hypothetical protein